MDSLREAGAVQSGAGKETKMDLRRYITPIPGARADAAAGGVRIPRPILTLAVGMAAALLLGVAVGRGLPTQPEASLSAQSAQGPSPATEPVVSYVGITPQSVDRPVSEEHIPTF
jgi:hypothetical protein